MSEGIHFIEGFEGDTTALVWERMSMTLSSDHARSGVVGGGAVGGGTKFGQSPLFPPTLGIACGFAFRNNGDAWSGNVVLCQVRGPTNVLHALVGISTQRVLTVETPDAGGSLQLRAVGTRQLDDGAWYYIECGFVGHATNGRVVVQINGPGGTPGEGANLAATDIDVTGIPTLRVGSPTVPAVARFYNQAWIGVSSIETGEVNMSFDDVYIRELDEGFLGDMEVLLVDLEDDRSIDFTRSSGSKNYLMVNETEPDEDGTYNDTETSGDEDVFEIADSGFTGEIHCVQLVARAKKTETEVWSLNTLIDLAGVKSYGAERYLSMPDYETLPPDVFGTAPGDLPWTVARLNALGVGYRAQNP